MQRGSFSPPYRNGGRSPFAGYAQHPADRSLSDLYSYTDDQHNVLSPRDIQQAVPVFDDDEESPDVVHVTYRGETWKIAFPPFSIAEEKVLVRHLRDRVAFQLKLEGQEGRVKLLYKEQDLRTNDTPLRKYGCKQNSEIHVIVTQEVRDYDGRRNRSGSDSDSLTSANRRKPKSEGDRKPHRSNSTYRRREDEPRSGYASSNGYLHPNHTPPKGNTPPRQQSPMRPSQPARQSPPTVAPIPQSRAPAVQRPQADPSSTLGKIQTMRYEFLTEWYPMIEDFIRAPPRDPEERTKEYRRLSEIAMKKVFEPGDAIEPEGPDKEEIRMTRKRLYNEAQEILKELDRFKPRE